MPLRLHPHPPPVHVHMLPPLLPSMSCCTPSRQEYIAIVHLLTSVFNGAEKARGESQKKWRRRLKGKAAQTRCAKHAQAKGVREMGGIHSVTAGRRRGSKVQAVLSSIQGRWASRRCSGLPAWLHFWCASRHLHTPKLLPHPQSEVLFGLENWNPPAISALL